MLEQAVLNHVESYNAFIERGLDKLVECLQPIFVQPYDKEDPNPLGVTVALTELSLCKPINSKTDANGDAAALGRPWMPKDCRVGIATYSGALKAKFDVRVGDEPRLMTVNADLGNIPIMVRSKRCNLHGLGPKELVRAGEDETEAGGYFVMNGIERVIRLLIAPRGNYPMAVYRPSYQAKGKLYTANAVLFRSIRPDGSTQTNTLHYSKDGACYLRFSYSRQEWFIPLVLAAQCLYPVSDRMLAELLAGGSAAELKAGVAPGPHHELWECVLVMLRQQNAKQRLEGMGDARAYLGRSFRPMLSGLIPRNCTDEEAGGVIVERLFLVHTQDGWLKLQTLCVMYQKLMALVRGEIEPDNQDTLSSHDVLLPGQVYGMVLKEVLEVMLLKLQMMIRKFVRKDDQGRQKHRVEDFRHDERLFRRCLEAACDVQKRMENFLATGNITSRSGLDLMQSSGFTVVADKLNQARFSSHFAAVHRGQYFSEMKTTTVRKLLPETWGFLCPVHTPDGAPCGLLNHLASSACTVVRPPSAESSAAVRVTLSSLGVQIYEPAGGLHSPPTGNSSRQVWVMLDGEPVGHIEDSRLQFVERVLRDCKVRGKRGIPPNLEIVCIQRGCGKLFPGLFLFLGPGRLLRPVRSLQTGQVEWIGPLEQLFLSVAVVASERESAHAAIKAQQRSGAQTVDLEDDIPEQLPVQYSHEELEPTRVLSVLAALTPFSNHNQSPRNMYQCQMLKQTMGTPYHNHQFRSDNKVFRILTPQKPVVRTSTYDNVDCDLHPVGTNAVVAVITYTGYDMEDAMIINKSSYERGFGHGVIYKTKVISAAPPRLSAKEQARCRFNNLTTGPDGKPTRRIARLDSEGLPPVGTFLQKDDPICVVLDHAGDERLTKYKDDEPCYVEHVSIVEGSEVQGGDPCQRAVLRLRYPRNPVVGDKFSSRHGQKGVMSILWPQEDMPFTESGITPDILFNPHGFPSRMTIGMLIESIAAKAAASEGLPTANATTFRKYTGHFGDVDANEADPFLQQEAKDAQGFDPTVVKTLEASDYFGHTLVKHGFQRLGTERMYSGIHGTEIETEIFVGVVYYQRLRHLVSDKAQVRARGRVDQLTNQPIKGRKNHGGIRFGEMERDSLLAHGASFLLHDRLMRCSDYDVAYVCPSCGSILTPQASVRSQTGWLSRNQQGRDGDPWECPPCTRKSKTPVRCHPMPIPWVFRYLANEMAAMNVRMQLRVADRARQTSLSLVGADAGAVRTT